MKNDKSRAPIKVKRFFINTRALNGRFFLCLDLLDVIFKKIIQLLVRLIVV